MQWYQIAEDNWVADVDGSITYLPATNYYTLDLLSNDTNLGTVPDSVTKAEGTQVTITATPTNGTFIKWIYTGTEMVYSSDITTVVTLNADISLTAVFEPVITEEYDLSLLADPEEGGSVTGAGKYLKGTNVNIVAEYAPGYTFSGWFNSDDLVSTDSNAFITLMEDTTLTAKFNKLVTIYTVTGTSNNANAIITGLGSYEEGTEVTLDVDLYHDTIIDSITVNGIEVTLPYTFNINENKIVEVNATTYFTIDLSHTGGGEVLGGGRFRENESTLISATATEGYTFVNWIYTHGGGEYSKSQAVLIDKVIENLSLTAVFEAIHYTNITLLCNVGGSVTGGGKFETGTKITISAVPDELYDFIGWYVNDELITQNAEYSFITEEDKTYTAKFKHKEAFVNVQSNQTTLGIVSGGGYFQLGSTVTITATPAAGCSIYKWYRNNVEIDVSGTSYSFELWTDTEVRVDFVKDPINYKLTITNPDTSIGEVTGDGIYPENTKATVTAMPKEGYAFAGWITNGGTYTITENPYSFVIRGNVELVATFREKYKYTISAVSSNEELGTVTGSGVYTEGEPCTLTAVPKDQNVKFNGWENVVDFQMALSNTNPYVFVPTGSREIIGHFARYVVVSTAVNNPLWGTVSSTSEYDLGQTALILYEASQGFMPDKLEINGKVVETTLTGRYSFIVEEPTSVKVYFKPITTETPIASLASSIVSVGSYAGLQVYEFNVGHVYKLSISTDGEFWNTMDDISINSERTNILIGDNIEQWMTTTRSLPLYFKLEEFIDGYLLNSQILSFTAIIPDTYYPYVVFESISLNKLFEEAKIAGYTEFNIPFTITQKAPEGFTNTTTLASYTATALSETTSSADTRSQSSSITGVVRSSTSDYDFYATVTVTDSRGVSKTYMSNSFKVNAYQLPNVNLIEVAKCTSTGTVSTQNEDNTFCKLVFDIDYSAVDNLNEAETPIITFGKNTYPAEIKDGHYYAIFGGDLDPVADYTALITYSDKVMSTLNIQAKTLNVTISNKLPISLLHKKTADGSFAVGAAFGIKATVSDSVQLGLDTLFSTGTNMHGTLDTLVDNKHTLIETTKPAYDVIDRGGQNSVAVSTDDIKASENASSGISYANNIRVMTSAKYKELGNNLDKNTIYILTDTTNL